MIDIRCCDYLELLGSIPGGTVSLILTDPPYGISYQNNFTSSRHQMLAGDDREFSYTDLANHAFRALKPDTAIFAFTGWSTYPQHFVELASAGFQMKEPVIGQKRPSGKTDLYGSFQSNSDWCMFGHKGRFKFRPTQLIKNKRAGSVPNKGRKPVAEFKTRMPSCWFGQEYPWSSENPSAQKQLRHPTIKGLTFIEWLIQISTNEGDLVVDPFCGSGTTPLACKRLNRNCIAGDTSREFVALAQSRLN